MKNDKIIHLSKLRTILLTSTEVVTVVAVLVFFYAFTGARNQLINEKIRNLNEETIELTINLGILSEKLKNTNKSDSANIRDEVNDIIDRSITDKNLKVFIVDSKGDVLNTNVQDKNTTPTSIILMSNKNMEKSFVYNGRKHLLSHRKLTGYKGQECTVILLKDQELLLKGYSYSKLFLGIIALILFLFLEHGVTYLYIRKVSEKI